MAKKGLVARAGADEEKRRYLSQADVPTWSLDHALKIAKAIAENYGKHPTKPLRVAEALGWSPSSSHFRTTCGASIAYGLTDGGCNADKIELTALGRRIVAPTEEGDDLAALKEALLRPRVIRDFLTRYSQSRLPNEQIARNVLTEIGVPPDRTAEVLALIVDGARALGLLRELKGNTYVDLDSMSGAIGIKKEDVGVSAGVEENGAGGENEAASPPTPAPATASDSKRRTGRVFITHGQNIEILGQLKDLLTFGGFTPVVAMEQETVSKPVPDKVMDGMRSCEAAIIHVGAEVLMLSPDGKQHKMLNQNVLIEIGAAMALYGRKFILLVEKGATLPSNLLGLYEVRYEGEKLDYESTMKLLKAFADFRG